MKISLRIKVALMTVILSVALIGSSVLISSLIYDKRSQTDAETDCRTAAGNMAARFNDYDAYQEFVAGYHTEEENKPGYAEKMRAIYSENYDDLVSYYENGFPSEEDEETYYLSLTAPLFPALSGFGMSYGQIEFRNNYNDILHEMLLVSSNFDTEGGYLYLYDEEHDYIVYMMDCSDKDSSFYRYPASIERPSAEWKESVQGKKEAGTYLKEVDRVLYCCGYSPVFDKKTGQIIAYLGYNYDMGKLSETRREFNVTITIIMLIAMAILTVIYLLLAERFVIRGVRRLTLSAAAFSGNLEKGKVKVVESGVRSTDEVGILSSEFETMQKKIVEYVDTIAEKTEEEHRREAELNIAADIQKEELPATSFEDDKISVCASFTAAKEVGGDFYDYFYTDKDHVAFVIADVTGKGIPAALFMMKAKGLIRSAVLSTGDLAEAMAKVNNALLENNRAGLFVTAFVGVVDTRTGEMKCISAGHERPYLIGKEIERLALPSNFVLGGIPNFRYQTAVFSLKDARLFLFTDGLNEAIDASETEYGYEGVVRSLEKARNLPSAELLRSVTADLDDFVGEKDPFDDVTMMVVALRGEALDLTFEEPGMEVIEQATAAFDAAFSSLSGEIRAKADVILDEMLNNYVSYESRAGFRIRLEAKLEGEALRIVITSNGTPSDPLAQEDRYVENVEQASIGGFGITIAKKLSDKMDYVRQGDLNVLTVTFENARPCPKE